MPIFRHELTEEVVLVREEQVTDYKNSTGWVLVEGDTEDPPDTCPFCHQVVQAAPAPIVEAEPVPVVEEKGEPEPEPEKKPQAKK